MNNPNPNSNSSYPQSGFVFQPYQYPFVNQNFNYRPPSDSRGTTNSESNNSSVQMLPQFIPVPVQPFPQNQFAPMPYAPVQFPFVPVPSGQFVPVQPMFAYPPQPLLFQQNLNQNADNRTEAKNKDFVELDDFQSKSLKEPVSPKAPRNVMKSTTTSEENAFKRCSRCGKYYKETAAKDQISLNISGNEKECRYHPGTFKSLYHSKLGSRGWMAWSCCKNEQRESTGCKINPSHLEDITTTHSLSIFHSHLNKSSSPPSSSSSNSKSYDSKTTTANYPLLDLDFTSSPPSPSTISNSMESRESRESRKLNNKKNNSLFELKSTKIVKADVNDNNVSQEYIEHRVRLTDTLQGLSLKYSVTLQEIKTENKLNKEEDLYTRRDIRIPYRGQKITEPEPTEEEKKKYKLEMQRMYIKRFKRAISQNGISVSDAEAKYYLKMNGWCLELAVEEFKDDISWEKSHPIPSPNKV